MSKARERLFSDDASDEEGSARKSLSALMSFDDMPPAAPPIIPMKKNVVKTPITQNLFDDDDDDDDEEEEEGEEGAAKENENFAALASDTQAKKDKKNAALLELVGALRAEINSLKAEVQMLKKLPPGEDPDYLVEAAAAEKALRLSGASEEDIYDSEGSSAVVDNALVVVEQEEEYHIGASLRGKKLSGTSKSKKGEKPPPVSAEQASQWEQLAAEEKERRQVRPRTGRRPVKRTQVTSSTTPLVTATTTTATTATNSSSGMPLDSATSIVCPAAKHTNSPKALKNVKRRDSFFDASSEEDSVAEERTSTFKWDTDSAEEDSEGWSSDDTPTKAPITAPANTVVDEAALQVEAEQRTRAWVRGKDIIAMLATVHTAYTGPMAVRLPPAWAWVSRPDGSPGDVADRGSITTAEIRKAYLRIVRCVHPDKQKLGQDISDIRRRAQAQAVFTALKDVYAVSVDT